MQSALLRAGPWESAAPPLRDPAVKRIGVGHALVDDCSADQVCSAIINYARSGGQPSYVITANAQHIVLLEKHRELREIYRQANLVLADGVSLLLAARLGGRAFQERIAGVDMFRQLCGLAAESGLRVFLLGGRPGSAERASAALRSEWAGLSCATLCPPVGFEQSAAGLSAVAARITAFRPHLLFVALGAPKQERWIYQHGLGLSVPVSIGVGGSFEMVGGVVRRAPLWVRNIGCEWLYRLGREPRRMWRRYTVGNLEFARIVARQLVRRGLLDACVRLATGDRFAAELQEVALQQSERTIALLTAIGSSDPVRPDSLVV